MKARLHPNALADIKSIFGWIEEDSPEAARRVVERIFAGIDRLAEFPEIGRIGRTAGTREWVIPRLPYIVVYELSTTSDELLVHAVFHGAQDR